MSKIATKLELTAYHLLEQGPQKGCTALTGLANCRDLNYRNGVSDLRKMGVSILDEYFTHQHSGGGIARMKRYWPESADDVLKLVALVNLKRAKRNEEPISPEQVAKYLKPYEETPTEAGE
ncbi:hypothetical protein ACK369_12405 [Aeromonas veronii]|uniref:hypothetical protein n=1 Tax=Aeromonas caviae TaxID=648 RepID=UPI0030046168